MANGRVTTGFSMPWVALYAASSGEVTYSGGIPLARGVDVSLSVEGGGDNNFYADNVLAETDTQSFSSGTVTLNVDGLKEAARKLIMGTTSSTTITVSSGVTVAADVWDDLAVAPYVGIGFIQRFMEDGVTSYAPYILTKCKFNTPEITAATQEDAIDWQTQSLEATIMRDDTTNHKWLIAPTAQSTEEAAYNVIKAVLKAGS